MREFDKLHLSYPSFTVEQGGVTAIIPREIFVSIRGDQKPTRNRPETDQKTDQKNRIVELLKTHPTISRSELAIELNIHESSVKRRLEALMKENRIKRYGPDNGGSWKVIE